MSDVSEVWRRLHNLIEAGDALVELRDLYEVAKGTEVRIGALRDEHLALEQAVAELQADRDALQADLADLSADYAAKRADAEAAHTHAIAALDDRLSNARVSTEQTERTLADRVSRAQADHAAALDRLGREEAGRQATLDALDVEIASRHARLDGIKREAERLLKGGD